jgi:hypothetical protein
MRFSDHFGLQTFEKLVRAHGKREDIRAILDGELVDAVRAYLGDLRAAGKITPVAGSGGRRVRIAEAWNSAASGAAFANHDADPYSDDARATRSIASSLFAPVVLSFSVRAEVEPSDEGIRAQFDALDILVSSGSTDEWRWRVDSTQDYVSGDRCRLELDQWRAKLTKFDEASADFVDCADIEPLPATTAEISVPSGQLIITDFLRCGAFDDAVTFDDDREYGAFSLNNRTGQARRTVAHAAEHNVACAQTTNTVVGIHISDDLRRVLVTPMWNAAADDEDEENGNVRIPGFSFKGCVSCDVWRIMAMDETTAAALAGAEAYAAYRKTDDVYAGNIVNAEIAPGRWRLTCGEAFQEASKSDFPLPDGAFAWMALELIDPT